jgi:uncharacterized protein (TIGR03089 family)
MPALPADVLAALLRSDPGRPRVTFYEDTPGPTQGERIELSAKVLANWVSKAANALQEEWDLGPGSTVLLAVPPHWRALYWALAVWSVGGTLVVSDGPGARPVDLLVTDDPDLASAAQSPSVLVTLAALARQAPGGSGSSMDEARELATYADRFSPFEEPAPSDVALSVEAKDARGEAPVGGAQTAYEDVVPQRNWPLGTRAHSASPDLAVVLGDALAAWSVDGSLVLSRGPSPSGGRAARVRSEGVTLEH